MAEGDGKIYTNFAEQILLGELDLGNGADEIKVILVAGHVANEEDEVLTDVSGDEETGTGYTAGGEVLANQSVSQESGNDRAVFDGDDVTWTGLDVGTPSHAIMYDNTHASDYLIAYWEVTTASNGGDYTLQWNASGIILLTCS